MNWLKAALTSSVGKKFVMGITGLLLCGFLVVHLAGNLLMLVGADAYNNYTHTLHSNEWFVKSAEVCLLVLFVVHLYLAIATTRETRVARGPVSYARKESKIQERILSAGVSPDSWMFLTGAVVLAFVLLHLIDFTFERRTDIKYQAYQAAYELHGEQVSHAFQKAIDILQTPQSLCVYLAGCIFLGFHLGHGFSSTFQSLGVSHPRYNGPIKWLGIFFAIVISVGFAFFPLWAIGR